MLLITWSMYIVLLLHIYQILKHQKTRRKGEEDVKGDSS